MKDKSFYYFIILICVVWSPCNAFAQRTSDGTFFVAARPTVSACSTPRPGIALEGGQYLLSSFWRAGIWASDYSQKLESASGDRLPEMLDHMHLRAQGDYLFRLAANYSRSVNLYAGGGVFLGYHAYQVLSTIPSELSGDFPSGEFIYGLVPSLEGEFFVSGRVAITLGVHCPVTFSSSLRTDLCHLDASLGVRVNL